MTHPQTPDVACGPVRSFTLVSTPPPPPSPPSPPAAPGSTPPPQPVALANGAVIASPGGPDNAVVNYAWQSTGRYDHVALYDTTSGNRLVPYTALPTDCPRGNIRNPRSWIAALCAVAMVLGPGAALASGAAGAFTLAAAGDIACTPGETGVAPTGQPNGPDNCQQSQTAQLVERLRPDAVAVQGDVQYNFGTLGEFMGSFNPTWGAFKSRIYPAPGNHEWYDSPNGAGYFDYFNGIGASSGRAGTRGLGYYSVDLNRYWHLITLNSNCTSDNPRVNQPVSCTTGSPQEQWLRVDLAAHRGQCIIAQWHHPLFTSGPNQGGPNDLATRSFWTDLYSAGATLVLNGHDHGYERFAPQTPTGVRNLQHGVREFVLGTGGKSLFGPGLHMAANSQVYNLTTFGVTVFTLTSNSYSWHFYRAPTPGNGPLVDSGSAPCTRPARALPPPPQSPHGGLYHGYTAQGRRVALRVDSRAQRLVAFRTSVKLRCSRRERLTVSLVHLSTKHWVAVDQARPFALIEPVDPSRRIRRGSIDISAQFSHGRFTGTVYGAIRLRDRARCRTSMISWSAT